MPRLPWCIWLMLSVSACARSLGAGMPDHPASESPINAGRCTEEIDLGRFFFTGMDATFLVLNGRDGSCRVYNPARAARRFIPASTFKIPNTLIALEAGTATGPEFPLAWDSITAPPSSWWPSTWRGDQTLRSAFRNSVYWYYQELARRVGVVRMRKYLAQFAYGNQDVGGGLDRFWLHGALRISPIEQIEFLRRFYEGGLDVSDRSTHVVKDLLLLDDTSAYRLSGKTGTADVTPTRELGWIVGYVERDGAVYYFALNMEGEEVWEQWPPQKRATLVRELLTRMAILPSAAP